MTKELIYSVSIRFHESWSCWIHIPISGGERQRSWRIPVFRPDDIRSRSILASPNETSMSLWNEDGLWQMPMDMRVYSYNPPVVPLNSVLLAFSSSMTLSTTLALNRNCWSTLRRVILRERPQYTEVTDKHRGQCSHSLVCSRHTVWVRDFSFFGVWDDAFPNDFVESTIEGVPYHLVFEEGVCDDAESS